MLKILESSKPKSQIRDRISLATLFLYMQILLYDILYMQILYGNFSIPLKLFENYMVGMMCGHFMRGHPEGSLELEFIMSHYL